MSVNTIGTLPRKISKKGKRNKGKRKEEFPYSVFLIA